MSTQLKLVQNYFKIISKISPEFAAKQGIKTFSKVRLKKIKTKELEFFSLANPFEIPFKSSKPLKCYELGNPNGKLIFLIHGWDSNIGSLTMFAKKIMETNKFRIIGVNLPAHGFHKEKRTNMPESGEAFKTILNYINPSEEFDIVSHSFGSGVATMGLSKSKYKADKIVFLTTPNNVKNIFDEFKSIVKMSDKAYKKMIKLAENKIIKEKIEDYSISNKLNTATYNKLLIIHDEFDKVLPIKNSIEIVETHPNTTLHKMQKIGHYRMLWNSKVVDKCLEFLTT